MDAQWGNARRHLVCDVADIREHLPVDKVDGVLFNGVMGYGVTGTHMIKIAPALHAVLRTNGLLLVGWNKGLVEDPLTLSCVTVLFGHCGACGLPARKEFVDSTHVFDVFAANPDIGSE